MGRQSLQIPPRATRFAAYGVRLGVVLLASSAPAVTRLSLQHSLGAVDLVVLRCVISGLIFLPVLMVRWARIPRELAVAGLLLAFLHGWGMHLTAIVGLRYAPAAHASALGPGFVP